MNVSRTHFDFRPLARRGGVTRISGLIYEETRSVLKVFLENAILESQTSPQCTTARRRKSDLSCRQHVK